jgi:VanZ family protein
MLRLWTPVVAWLAVSFIASAQSDVGGFGRVPDWITHGAEYLVLGVLLCRALAGGFGAPLTLAAAALAVALCTAWGVSDEWHQSFVPGRDSSAADVVKDFGGSVLGAAIHLEIARRGRR